MINVFKRRLIYQRLVDVELYQVLGFPFTEVPSMVWDVMYGSTENKSEEELYELSLQLEPRNTT